MSNKEVKQEEVAQLDSQVKGEVEFTQEQALNILIQTAKLANKRGAFELEETELILKAIRVFIPKQ